MNRSSGEDREATVRMMLRRRNGGGLWFADADEARWKVGFTGRPLVFERATNALFPLAHFLAYPSQSVKS